MRVRVTDSELLSDLVDYLAGTDTVIEQIDEDEVEVSLLGSFNEDALRMELYLRLRAWEASRRARGVRVEILP